MPAEYIGEATNIKFRGYQHAWLEKQPGGKAKALRKLVDQAIELETNPAAVENDK